MWSGRSSGEEQSGGAAGDGDGAGGGEGSTYNLHAMALVERTVPLSTCFCLVSAQISTHPVLPLNFPHFH